MNQTYTDFREKFFEIIEESQNILITSHKNPDDDSIASVLSIYSIIKTKYPAKNIQIMYSSPIGDRWEYFENFKIVKSVPDIADHISEFDLVIGLDGGQFYRFSSQPEKFADFTGKTICIDHHSSADTFSLSCVISEKTSTAELIYNIFLEDTKIIPHRLAECIILGIIGDTGTFKYINSKQIGVFDVIKRLVGECNLDIQYLKSRYEGFSERIYRLINTIMENSRTFETDGWSRYMCAFLPHSYLTDGNYSAMEIHEATQIYIAMFGLSIKGVNWAFIVYPLPDGGNKVSFRSLPKSVNVRALAEDMYAAGKFSAGGGHDRASGGTILEDSTEECIRIIQTWINENEPNLS